MTSWGTPTPYKADPVRNTFHTPLPHPPLTPQASLQLLASLELVATEGEVAPPPRYSLDLEASSQKTRPASSAPDSPSIASTVSCNTEGVSTQTCVAKWGQCEQHSIGVTPDQNVRIPL